jgi:hypothetical protein
MPAKREILHAIFLECCEHTPDTFWEGVFEDLAYGKCPYGSYISKGFFCSAQKKKEFSYKIETKDSAIMYSDIHSLLCDKLGLLSQKDRNKRKNALIAAGDRVNTQEWGSIRKKSVKDMCVEKFVVEAKETWDLSLKQARYLLSVIVLAMVFKAITTKDISFSNGKITSIAGIVFKKGEIDIDENLRLIDMKSTPLVPIDKKSMSDTWEKYIKELRKSLK